MGSFIVKSFQRHYTRAKDWWPVKGRSIFSHVLDYALEYARQVG